MKKYFVTGLVILLPLTLTFLIVSFVFNLLTEPFVGIVKSILGYYGLLENGFLFLSAGQIQKYFSQLIILTLLLLFTVGLGWLTSRFFIHYLINLWDSILHRIPFINNLYKAFRDVIHTIFKTDSTSFKKVALVPFPSENSLAMALVTKEDIQIDTRDESDWLTAVFMPTAPNPTSGFVMMFHKNDLIPLEIKVDDAFKYIVSCGIVATSLTPNIMQELADKLKKETPS